MTPEARRPADRAQEMTEMNATETYETVTLKRDGDRPLKLAAARLIGSGEHGTGGNSEYRTDWTRGVKVRIYRRRAGGYAWSRTYWTRWQGESGSHQAGLAADGGELLEAIRDQDGFLLTAESEAWAGACDADPDLAPLACEVVE